MRNKVFTLLCLMLLTMQFAAAQKNLYVISKSGELSVFPATAKVTFDNSDLLAFTYGKAVDVTENSFTASFTVSFKSSNYKSLATTAVVGFCYSSVNDNPTVLDTSVERETTLSDEHSFCIEGLVAGTTYHYRAMATVGNVTYYGDVHDVTISTDGSYTVINGHRFIDLGLPSGALWAETNIGAATAVDYGDYFAWGETAPKSVYSWDAYVHGHSSSSFSKYNTTDHKTTLEPEDDAAYVNWESPCRMPTSGEMAELADTLNCTWTWTTVTKADSTTVNGYKVVSRKNGNSIFLPASGYNVDETTKRGSHTYYWTSTLYSNNIAAYNLYFYSRYYSGTSSNDRNRGYAIRPVVKP